MLNFGKLEVMNVSCILKTTHTWTEKHSLNVLFLIYACELRKIESICHNF